jgi:hypothetical protein
MYLTTFKEEMKMRMNLLFSPLTMVGMKDWPKWHERQKKPSLINPYINNKKIIKSHDLGHY